MNAFATPHAAYSAIRHDLKYVAAGEPDGCERAENECFGRTVQLPAGRSRLGLTLLSQRVTCFDLNPSNMALQYCDCNLALDFSGAHTGHAMGEELKRRHGYDVLDRIQADNLAFRGQRMEVWQIVAKVKELVGPPKHGDR